MHVSNDGVPFFVFGDTLFGFAVHTKEAGNVNQITNWICSKSKFLGTRIIRGEVYRLYKDVDAKLILLQVTIPKINNVCDLQIANKNNIEKWTKSGSLFWNHYFVTPRNNLIV